MPINTNQLDESRPRFIEADNVAHYGQSIAGNFVYTVNTVVIAAGWIESRALWGKGQHGAFKAFESIENSFPFKVRGFDSDNGSEFLNWNLFMYFTKRKRPVEYSRSRAYKKMTMLILKVKTGLILDNILGIIVSIITKLLI